MNPRTENIASRRRGSGERGIALITALLLLALLTGLSIAMFLAVNADMLTNGYYRNFRGSYYAADSGLAIVRQDLKNKIYANMQAANKNTPPLTTAIESSILSQLKAAWASNTDYKSLTEGSAISGTVPARFRIEPDSFTFSLVKCYTDTNPTTCTGVTDAHEWTYLYSYHMVSVGQVGLTHQNRVEESGTLTVFVPVEFNIPSNFAGYGLYIQKQDLCPSNSNGFAPGTIYGPVYTETCFTFGTSGQVTFKDKVGCGGSKAGYDFGQNCVQKADTWAKSGNTTIKPDFQGGLYFGVEKQNLPDSSFSQKQAVLDGKGLTSPSSATWKADAAGKLTGVNGNYTTTTSSGVFLPVESGKIAGGGIYVSGNATISLSTGSVSIAGQTYLQQIYTIVNNGQTTTVTVSAQQWPSTGISGDPRPWNPSSPLDPPYTVPGSGLTTISSGGKSQTFQGVPAQMNNAGTPVANATSLYVDGNITSLSGQVQDGTALTITAATDVTITGNVTYKTKPVTTADNESVAGTSPSCCQTQKYPADTVIPGNDRGQALGIFTANGDIYTSLKNNGNLEVDASLATISQNGDGGLKIPDSSAMINNLTILGGRIHNSIYATSKLGSRSVYFDRRFGGRFGPPFFPSTSPPGTIPPAGDTQVKFQRQQWVNQTSY